MSFFKNIFFIAFCFYSVQTIAFESFFNNLYYDFINKKKSFFNKFHKYDNYCKVMSKTSSQVLHDSYGNVKYSEDKKNDIGCIRRYKNEDYLRFDNYEMVFMGATVFGLSWMIFMFKQYFKKWRRNRAYKMVYDFSYDVMISEKNNIKILFNDFSGIIGQYKKYMKKNNLDISCVDSYITLRKNNANANDTNDGEDIAKNFKNIIDQIVNIVQNNSEFHTMQDIIQLYEFSLYDIVVAIVLYDRDFIYELL